MLVLISVVRLIDYGSMCVIVWIVLYVCLFCGVMVLSVYVLCCVVSVFIVVCMLLWMLLMVSD